MTLPQPGVSVRAAFDLGGTFTDVVCLNPNGEIGATKVLSLPDRVGTDVRQALPPGLTDAPAAIRHASTVASNAVIEGRLAKIGLITTTGFRDVLEMRDQRRPPIIDARWVRPVPLAPRHLRHEVDERVLADGSVHRTLDPADAARAIAALAGAGVAVIAVCLINSYVNGVHERLIEQIAGELAPDLPVCLSCDGFAVIREYERTSTVCLNAGLLPIVSDYLNRLEEQLRVAHGSLLIMKSDAGMMTSDVACRCPARMVESGPAAGVLAAAQHARRALVQSAIAFDMGGTTAKASLIEAGRPPIRPRAEIGAEGSFAARLFGGAGHIVAAPTLDIAEVGAGGGSLAVVGRDGVLHVGPQGAGADPGPVCYGRGGSTPTVTDANVVLGYMNPVDIAGGTVRIDRDAAARAIADQIARPLRTDLHAAALGIVRVADATMLRAIRAVTIERGRDPREATLIAYGGCGPLHACRLATSLGVTAIQVPELCGLFSAVGLLLASRQAEQTHSTFRPLSEIEAPWAQRILATLRSSINAEIAAEDRDPGAIVIGYEADLQYRYEQATLSVPLPPHSDDVSLRRALADSFTAEHRRRFGFEAPETIFLSALRARATIGSPTSDLLPRRSENATSLPQAGTRAAFFGGDTTIETPVLRRRDLSDSWADGPLLVEEPESVTVVPPDWMVRLESSGALALSRPTTRSDRRPR